jgi:hypothetical protein
MGDRKIRLFPQTDGGALGLMPIPADQKPASYLIELLDERGAVLSSSEVAIIDAHLASPRVRCPSAKRCREFDIGRSHSRYRFEAA